MGIRCFTLSVLLFGLVACQPEALLALTVVVPEGPDPFAGADSVKIRLAAPDHQQTIPVSDPATFAVESTLDVHSEVSRIEVEALSAGVLLARGETPPLILRPVDDAFSLLVGTAGELSQLKSRSPSSARDMGAIILPAWGILLAGGTTFGGEPLASYALYDFFSHEFVTDGSDTLPEPRADAVALSCGGRCGVLALGRSSAGLAQTILVYNGSWTALADGLDPGQRREQAGYAVLDDGTAVVAGGLDGEGRPLKTLLRVDPGAGLTPRITLLPQPLQGTRRRPVVAASGKLLVIAGGQAPGEEVVELLSLEAGGSESLSWPGPRPVTGVALVAADGGKVLVLGGADYAGTRLADGWIVDTLARTVHHVPGALRGPRSGHSAMRVGRQVVVIGGDGEAALATELEVLSFGLQKVHHAAHGKGRRSQTVQRLGPGTFFAFGGANDSSLMDTVDVYQTHVAGP